MITLLQIGFTWFVSNCLIHLKLSREKKTAEISILLNERSESHSGRIWTNGQRVTLIGTQIKTALKINLKILHKYLIQNGQTQMFIAKLETGRFDSFSFHCSTVTDFILSR